MRALSLDASSFARIPRSFACANVDQPFLYASLGDEILAQAHEMKAQAPVPISSHPL